MQLGAFSVSLAVKELAVSRAFYEKLGFATLGGDADQGWLILKNGDVVLGLFQGMFDKNMLTFNPGWDQNAEPTDPFTDVRELQARLEAEGLTITTRTDESTTGPAHFCRRGRSRRQPDPVRPAPLTGVHLASHVGT